jgi:hypothetical protein
MTSDTQDGLLITGSIEGDMKARYTLAIDVHI